MKSLCKCSPKCSNPLIGLFFLRVITGIIFLYHGINKFQHLTQVSDFLLTYHIPAFGTFLIAAIEVLGGIALIVGAWTCIFASLLALEMLVTIFVISRSLGWQGNEFGILLLASLAAIKSTGGGKWKVMHSCGCFGSRGKSMNNGCEKCGHDSHSTCACECHPK